MTAAKTKKLAVILAMTLTTVTVWTGSPLLALWVGSQAQGPGGASMTAILVVLVCLVVTTTLLMLLLSWLSRIDDKLSDRKPKARQRAPWLQSMRGERTHYAGEPIEITALERVLIIVIAVGFVVFQVWFLFFAGSPLPD